jgi:hypothetical protein
MGRLLTFAALAPKWLSRAPWRRCFRWRSPGVGLVTIGALLAVSFVVAPGRASADGGGTIIPSLPTAKSGIALLPMGVSL